MQPDVARSRLAPPLAMQFDLVRVAMPPDAAHSYDYVLVSDCLVFQELHAALLDAIDFLLAKPQSPSHFPRAVLVAPKRSGSLDAFVALARRSGWWVEVKDFLKGDRYFRIPVDRLTVSYNRDTMYPYMLQLSRSV